MRDGIDVRDTFFLSLSLSLSGLTDGFLFFLGF